MVFLSKEHEEHFRAFLHEAYIDLDVLERSAHLDEFFKRQLAFLYMIAYYQEDYKKYEGDAFYVEDYDGMEIGGPTYLLEDEVGLREAYPHEYVIHYAKGFLIDRYDDKELNRANETIQILYQHAKAFCQ